MLLLDRRRVAALSLPALIGRCRSTPASYVADEKIRGSLPFPRYALHNILMGCELYLINRVE
jgi:hypothetical protein